VAAKTTDLETRAGELASLIARLARQLAREGLPLSRTRLSVLATLRTDGPMRLTNLAALEHVAQPTMTTLVSRLAEEGWVERRPDPSDGRVVNVALTPAGEHVLDRAIDLRDQALRARITRLSPAQQAQLSGALDALGALLED
jgi:DNA-binding MarR family transcriptional regulator